MRLIDADKIQYYDDEQGFEIAYKVDIDALPTLTPPNEWVSRVRELDELYTKLQAVTGFTVEQLREMFLAGYTLEKPDYSNHFAEMESLAEAAPPNEWVSVEDELPARDGIYLVYTTRGSVTTAHFYAEKIFRDDYKRKASWQGNRNVTHWMPLPTPPDSRPPEVRT